PGAPSIQCARIAWQSVAIRYDYGLDAAVLSGPFDRAEPRQCGDRILPGLSEGGFAFTIIVTHAIVDETDWPQPPGGLAHQQAGERLAIGAGAQNGSSCSRSAEPRVDHVLDPRSEHQ